MRRMIFSMLVLGSVLPAIACERVMQPKTEAAIDAVQKMVFVRHPSGLCIGAVKSVTYYGYTVYSLTVVPETACQRVEQSR